jgi:hypothetical protein
VDVPWDGEDVEPAVEPEPRPSTGPTFGTTAVPGPPARGAANPRGRQQRRKKRR